MDPVTLKLAHPIELGSERVEELVFRAPRLEDFRDVDLADITKMNTIMLVAGRVTGQTGKAIGRVSGTDVGAVVRVVSDFFAACLGSGPEQ